jgi:hypothetical protein
MPEVAWGGGVNQYRADRVGQCLYSAFRAAVLLGDVRRGELVSYPE